MTDLRQQAARERRLRSAMLQTFDTGNALQDAWDQLMIEEDPSEIEMALIGEPEIVAINDGDDEIMVLKDTDYYIEKLKDYWIDAATDALDLEEQHHGNKRQ